MLFVVWLADEALGRPLAALLNNTSDLSRLFLHPLGEGHVPVNSHLLGKAYRRFKDKCDQNIFRKNGLPGLEIGQLWEMWA